MGSAFHQLCPRYSGTLTPTAPTAIRLWDTFYWPFSSTKCFCVLILVINTLIKVQKSLKQFSPFNIAHLSKCVVNSNLIKLSKLKYIVILKGLFCTVVI